MPRQHLNANTVIKSLALLNKRIDERFPSSGLSIVCRDLTRVAEKTTTRSKRVKYQGSAWLIATWTLALIGGAFGALLISSALFVEIAEWNLDLRTVLANLGILSQNNAIETIATVMLAIFGGILGATNFQNKATRQYVFKHLHELRSYAHVIDMHQLTKDPVTLSRSATRTESSPERTMTRFELARYLDYCTEMLSLTGKLAALYGEQTDDGEITGAVNEIETLTAGISRKIWQKITILNRDFE